MCIEQITVIHFVLILQVISQVLFNESFYLSKLLEELLTVHMTYGMDHSQAVDRLLMRGAGYNYMSQYPMNQRETSLHGLATSVHHRQV